VRGIEWPGVPTAAGATMLALQYQLERSQWWPPARLIEHQFRQLRELAAHALANAPFYRRHLEHAGLRRAADLTPDAYLRWPVLKKGDVRSHEAQICAARQPAEHGGKHRHYTTGSTGEPTPLFQTEVTQLFASALVLRDHLWQRRDFRRKYASIRSRLERAARADWWSGETNVAFRTGPLATISALADANEIFDWLIAERPAYLLCFPTTLRALLERSRETGTVPQALEQVITFTEMLPPDLRGPVEREWSTRLIDVYSCEEFGPIALQCPEHDHYHVQAENLYVEILREDGAPCEPGETGIVVVTSLHNFAMPLLRYELGDYAERGEPCDCGRGLPVLRRIVGRVRNMARDPQGRRFRPFIPFGGWLEIAPIRRIQLIQKTPAGMELRYVMERELSSEECARLTALLQRQLGYPFDIAFSRVPQIERRPGEKFEDFISELG
jgi:phenylacetate-CoA ligase